MNKLKVKRNSFEGTPKKQFHTFHTLYKTLRAQFGIARVFLLIGIKRKVMQSAFTVPSTCDSAPGSHQAWLSP